MTKAVLKRRSDFTRIIYSLLFSSLVAIVLILVGAEKARSGFYFFMIYNMALAFIPLVLAIWLTHRLKTKGWLTFGNIVLTLLWLGFLPNSFYMITDLIHVQSSIGIDLLYNIVLVLMCIFNALISGYISLYLVHWALLKRFYYRNVHILIGFIILLCSFAIYLGRYLRWNSWDVIVNPAGLLFDVTDSVASPSTHPQVFSTTVSFFFLLTTMYVVIWQITRVLRQSKQVN